MGRNGVVLMNDCDCDAEPRVVIDFPDRTAAIRCPCCGKETRVPVTFRAEGNRMVVDVHVRGYLDNITTDLRLTCE